MKQLLCLAIAVAIASFSAHAQTGSISGQITDAQTGEPLIGATVLIDVITRGASTDVDGNYRLELVPEGTYNVRFTYVGYTATVRTVEVTADTETELDVALETDYLRLDEAVVIGYGTRDRRDLTGAVTTIPASAIENLPVSNVESLLQGRSAGVQITQASGLPGGEVAVRIRGAASIGAGNQPLYVVDGIPIYSGTTATSLAGNAGEHTTSALADLNPNDIESIEILKDASATAIYGSQAANGVVLITTKRGRAAATEVSIGHYTGFATETNRLDIMDGPEYMEINRERVGDFDGELFGFMPGDNIPTYNWMDEVHRTGLVQESNIAIRGGDERTRFYLGGTYSDQEGYLIANRFRRTSGRLNIDHTLSPRVQIGTSIGINRGLNNRVGSDNLVMGLITSSALSAPITPIYQEDGSYNFAQVVPGNIAFNTVAEADLNTRDLRTFRSLGNAYANFVILDGLEFNSTMGVDWLETDNMTRYSELTGSGRPDGSGSRRKESLVIWTMNNTLNYITTFDDVHRVNLLAGNAISSSRREGVFVAGTGFPSDFFRNVTSAAQATSTSSYTDLQAGVLSFFGRFLYSYNDRYILEGSARLDGSSRFGDDHQYGFFPAAAIGWRISEEQFMQDNDFFDEIKLRASIGIVGNDNIGDFASRGLFGGGFDYDFQPGLAPSQIASPDLRWEETVQYDIGLDLVMLNNRLSFTADYYNKYTRDMILDVPLPTTSGFSSVISNVGEMSNQGFEFTIESQNMIGEFQWSTSFNISTNRNRVERLVGDEPILGIRNTRAVEGRELGVFFLNRWHGVNPETGAPQWLTADGEVTETRLDADRVYVGSVNPDFFGGFTNNFSFRGFDLNVFFQFVQGIEFYNDTKRFLYNSANTFNNSRDLLNRWRQPGDQVDHPATQFGAAATGASTRFLEDASYIRLKTLTLGYTLPANVINQIGLQRARVFVQGHNLLTFTDFSGLDPEVVNQGTSTLGQGSDFFTPPPARTIMAGFNITL